MIGTDIDWMKLALREAGKAGPDIPVGCVIVLDNKVIASQHNLKEVQQDPTAHAELLALREASQVLNSWRLDKTTLYTTLEPCPMCAEAILQARVSRLVFGAYDLRSGAAGSAFNLFTPGRLYPLPEVVGGMSEEECKALLINFFRNNAAEQ